MRAVSEQLAAADVDWTSDLATRTAHDQAHGWQLESLVSAAMKQVNERFDRGEQR